MLRAEVLRIWANALRSGHYTQVRGHYFEPGTDEELTIRANSDEPCEACAVGALILEGVRLGRVTLDRNHLDQTNSWLGDRPVEGAQFKADIISLNDQHELSFEEIANFLDDKANKIEELRHA